MDGQSVFRIVLFTAMIITEVAQSQYYGRYIPCAKSYMDPDGDCLAGVGGKDYPMLTSIPATSFDCRQHRVKYFGYFADVEAQCQVFHVCLSDGRRDSFLCPNGTLFNQQFLVCDWWFNVKCREAQKLYTINEYLQAPVNFRLGPMSPKVAPLPASHSSQALQSMPTSDKKGGKGQSILSTLLFGSPSAPSSGSGSPVFKSHGSVASVPLTAASSPFSSGEKTSMSVPVSASMSYQNPTNKQNSGTSGIASAIISNLFSSFINGPKVKATPQMSNSVLPASGDSRPSNWPSSGSVIQPRVKSDLAEPSPTNLMSTDLKPQTIGRKTVQKQTISGSPR